MTDIVSSIKQIAQNTVKTMKLSQVEYGIVTAIDPLKIQISDFVELTAEFFILTDRVKRKVINLKHNHEYGLNSTTDNALVDEIVIQEGLKVGDKVILARVVDSNDYVVIDKVGVMS
jgi:hypothetical protein